nr:photosystem I assembly protein Ycf4 [Aneura pinguis]WGO61260.1 photosystem I assembly protein Ycf4 [Aneura pinguis]WGO61346.1 photosystem I assembly protein Ycf4 [Aneura pinguis]
MDTQVEDIRVDFIKGSRRFSNLCWALILFLGAISFSCVGFSSYLRGDIIPFPSSEQILFIPQGLVMYLYGIAGLFISLYLWCTIWWNVGSGYNKFDRRKEIFSLFRWGFPGKNRRILMQISIMDIQAIRIEVREGFLSHGILYMRMKGRRDIPLSRIEEYPTLEAMETEAAKLAHFSNISIEST